MMFRGSPGLTADQLAAISAAFGGDDNADTQQAVTQYFFTTPAENLEVALCASKPRACAICCPTNRFGPRNAARSNRKSRRICRIPNMFFTATSRRHVQRLALRTRRPRHAPVVRQNHRTPICANFTTPGMRRTMPFSSSSATWNRNTVLEQVKNAFGDIPAKALPARPEFNFSPVTAGHA